MLLNVISFGFEQFKNFWLCGYGCGSFSKVFKLFYEIQKDNLYNIVAEHEHNDVVELLGEIGVLGILLLSVLYFFYFKKITNNIKEKKQFARFVLLSLLILTLSIQSFVDYSLHIPGIMVLLMTILSTGLINFNKKSEM